MNKIFIAAILLLAAPVLAQAQGTSTTGTEVQSSVDGRREFGLSPGVTYSDENGWLYGVSGSFAFPMTLRSQIELGGILFRKVDDDEDRDASGVFGGPIYNFGSSYQRAFFVGAGVGYSNIFPFQEDSNLKERLVWGYGQVGKRFALSDEGNFSYKPRFVYYFGGDNESEFQLDALNFSYLF